MKRFLLILIVCLQAIVGFADNWIDFAVEPAKNSDGAPDFDSCSYPNLLTVDF